MFFNDNLLFCSRIEHVEDFFIVHLNWILCMMELFFACLISLHGFKWRVSSLN